MKNILIALLAFGGLTGFTPEELSMMRVLLTSSQEATLSAQISAEVKGEPVKMGQAFKKGDLLLQLDDTIYKASLMRAQAAEDKAAEDAKAQQQLFKDGSGSLTDLTNAQATYVGAQAQVIISKHELSSCQLLAPYDGHMVNVYVNLFETVQVGQQLIQIVNDTMLYGQFLIPSTSLSAVKIGAPISFSLMETPDLVHGVVAYISPVIDPSSSMVKVYADINNSANTLRPGMTGYVHEIGLIK